MFFSIHKAFNLSQNGILFFSSPENVVIIMVEYLPAVYLSNYYDNDNYQSQFHDNGTERVYDP